MNTASSKLQAAGYIVLHPEDNVACLTRTVPAGGILYLDDQAIKFQQTLGLGHKIATAEIVSGQSIVKYGVPIGSATADIKIGDHVHRHNMKSDYKALEYIVHERQKNDSQYL